MISANETSNTDPIAELNALLRDVLDRAALLWQPEVPGLVEAAEETIIYAAELKPKVYGHYCPDSWTYGKNVRPEIVINADFLNSGEEDLILTVGLSVSASLAGSGDPRPFAATYAEAASRRRTNLRESRQFAA